MSRILFILALSLLLPACATRQYEWDNYDARLYRYYKEPNSAEEFRVSMEAHLKMLEGKRQRPAPGLYAELGTLYLERGDRLTAATYYQKERDAWAESRHLMDVMLASLQRMQKGTEGK
jgi:hypothetical protein